jgi:hypothetical protein
MYNPRATAANHLARLKRFTADDFKELDGAWLTTHPFHGTVTADQLAAGYCPKELPGDAYVVYQAALHFGMYPKGIVNAFAAEVEGACVYVGPSLTFQSAKRSKFSVLGEDRVFEHSFGILPECESESDSDVDSDNDSEVKRLVFLPAVHVNHQMFNRDGSITFFACQDDVFASVFTAPPASAARHSMLTRLALTEEDIAAGYVYAYKTTSHVSRHCVEGVTFLDCDNDTFAPVFIAPVSPVRRSPMLVYAVLTDKYEASHLAYAYKIWRKHGNPHAEDDCMPTASKRYRCV